MKKFVVVFVVSLFFASLAYAESVTTSATPAATGTSEVAAKKYFCPMDGFESDKPGKCERCGMELIERKAPAGTTEAASAAAPVVEATAKK